MNEYTENQRGSRLLKGHPGVTCVCYDGFSHYNLSGLCRYISESENLCK